MPIGLEDLNNRSEIVGKRRVSRVPPACYQDAYDTVIGVCVQILVVSGGGPGITTKPNSQTLHCIKVMIHPA